MLSCGIHSCENQFTQRKIWHSYCLQITAASLRDQLATESAAAAAAVREASDANYAATHAAALAEAARQDYRAAAHALQKVSASARDLRQEASQAEVTRCVSRSLSIKQAFACKHANALLTFVSITQFA
jgi:uncharacterized iron-regulated protein